MVLRHPQLCSAECNNVDLVFVVDISRRQNVAASWPDVQRFIVQVIQQIILNGPLSGSRVGLVLFSGVAENIIFFNTYV